MVLALAAGCGPTYKTTKADLDMKSYAKAPDASAVVLERTGLVILGYSEQVNDTTMFKGFGKPSGGGGAAGVRPGTADDPNNPADNVQDTRDMISGGGVSSYTAEVQQRLKIFNQEGLAAARVEEDFPAGVELESVAGTTFLPDGTKVELDTSSVKTEGGKLTFEMPGAKVGAVLEYSYKVFSKNLSTLEGWAFQGGRPTAISSFSIKMRPGTSFPYRFVKTADDQDSKPKEERVLGMDKKETIVLSWQLTDLPAVTGDRKPAALLIGD
jgi:hypothetical protein